MEYELCWKFFWDNLPKLMELTEPIAKRSGLTALEAVILTIINDYPQLNLPINIEIFDKLISKGMILDNNCYKVTGKGAILAKAFSEIRKNGL